MNKPMIALGLLCLLLAGCASWPDRGPDYWRKFVDENKPRATDSAEFLPTGAIERDVDLGEDSDFSYRFIEKVNGDPWWVVHINPDHSGFFIFQERMQDGDSVRTRNRKLDFTLSDEEYAKVRTAILDSGFISIRSNYSGSEDSDWTVSVGVGSDAKTVNFEGTYPNEAQNITYGVYDIVVRPRADEMATAPEFKAEPNAPEYRPLD